ncbi:MAG: DUF4058 family protein [Pirellulales bacterium]
MAIHDWARVDPGIFHDFHQAWTVELCNSLNSGVLPSDYFAMTEQSLSGPVPDVVTLQRRSTDDSHRPKGGVAVADTPPKTRIVTSAVVEIYAGKANRITIRHRLGQVVAVIEVVSPGNKSSQHALRAIVMKAEELLRQGINLLVVDLFPPSSRDPQGIHKAIWDEIAEEPFELPHDKQLTAASYSATPPITAYVELLAVGDPLPSLPLFLEWGTYVPTPLEETYLTTWGKRPEPVRQIVESPSH